MKWQKVIKKNTAKETLHGVVAWCGRYMIFKALEGELKRGEYIQVQEENQEY